MAKITIYTDGAAKGNPGNGGYGVVMMSGKHRKELSEGFRLTTNNRMELLSVIVALESIKNAPADVAVFSDSKYVVDSVEKGWVFGWQKKGFKGKKNIDLWKRFLLIYPKHKVKFNWVKGHAGNVFNERCDELAVDAAEGNNLLIDEGYEQIKSDTNLFGS
ncbi:MAG: ribonuclease HI [Flavobacteriales bacterium]|nr:ribonuclease HI [Flavobacteriales bacterium]